MDSFPPFGGNQSVKSGNGSHNGMGTHNHNGNQNSHSPINKSQSMGNVLMRKRYGLGRFPNPDTVYGLSLTSTAVIERKCTTGNSYQYWPLLQIYHK
jgi:hypothetical protein